MRTHARIVVLEKKNVIFLLKKYILTKIYYINT